jgi:hypothetical protein
VAYGSRETFPVQLYLSLSRRAVTSNAWIPLDPLGSPYLRTIQANMRLKRFKARSASRKLARKVFSFIYPVYVWFLDMSGYTGIYRIQDNTRN